MHAGNERTSQLHHGLRLQALTIAWMLLETAFSAGAGIAAHSVLLLAVAAGSLVDLLSSFAVYYLFRTELNSHSQEGQDRLEHITARGVGSALLLAAVFVLCISLYRLAKGEGAADSYLGIAIAIVASIFLPGLARGKLRLAAEMNSRPLRADGISTLFCFLMSAVMLAGLVANTLLHWWWLDATAALLLVPLLVKEGLEAWRSG